MKNRKRRIPDGEFRKLLLGVNEVLILHSDACDMCEEALRRYLYNAIGQLHKNLAASNQSLHKKRRTITRIDVEHLLL